MDESIIRTVSLFFYLNFFDTKQSFWASQRTLAIWRSHGTGRRADLIPIAKRFARGSRTVGFFSTQKPIGEFVPPPDFNMQAWMEFKKRSDEVEYETVLMSQVLGFSDNEIADGLGVSEGTVRHRLSRGLRELGSRL